MSKRLLTNLVGRIRLGWRLPLFILLASVGVATAQQTTVPLEQQHVGRVIDWSYRHIIFSGGLPVGDSDAAKAEPRILFHLAERNPDDPSLVDPALRIPGLHDPREILPPRDSRPPVSSLNRRVDGMRSQKGRNIRVDWSVALGSGNVPANMFPAKYQFNVNGTPSCTTDYVVYGLNVAGVSNGQPNLVGINNLYSGTGRFLRGKSRSLLGVQRQHSIRFGPDLAHDFDGWHQDRLCGKRRHFGGISCFDVEVGGWDHRQGESSDRSPVMHGLNKLFNLSDPLDNRDYYVFIGVG